MALLSPVSFFWQWCFCDIISMRGHEGIYTGFVCIRWYDMKGLASIPCKLWRHKFPLTFESERFNHGTQRSTMDTERSKVFGLFLWYTGRDQWLSTGHGNNCVWCSGCHSLADLSTCPSLNFSFFIQNCKHYFLYDVDFCLFMFWHHSFMTNMAWEFMHEPYCIDFCLMTMSFLSETRADHLSL